ncbi:hemolysin family protein [Azospirillum halopraeferens]|uniref:hemolysin family protein n=1 Tax=Azospirillum halopraeferens TaxID=34010 RepID=UPI000423F034|nr:hemolysin family protein [Azospirillum halopraeferens]
MIGELLVILLLILVNGFFALSELAVISARRARLQQLAEEHGSRRARAALALAEDPGRFLSAVQIGITLVGIVAGAYGGAAFAEPLGTMLNSVVWIAPYGEGVAFALIVAAITYLSLIVGELVPKRMALAHAEPIAMAVAGPMTALSRIAGPFTWLLAASTEGLLRLLRLPATRAHTVTEEEVKLLIREGTRSGVFAPAERQMIEGVLRLSDRPVRAIMTPRHAVVWLDPDDPPDAVAGEIAAAGFSRFPVCHGQVDEVQGIVAAGTLLDRALRGQPFDLRAAMVDALIVHDGTPVIRLLELFREATVRMAVVVDEYGSVEGIVTVTDILESIAGDLPVPGEARERAVRRDDGSWLLDGMTPIDEVEALLGLSGLAGEGDYHTLAGFVLDRLGHLPVTAEHVTWRGLRFEVVDMDGRRIDKVMIRTEESATMGPA